AYIMQALADDPSLAAGYSYPVQIDFDTRLSSNTVKKGGDDFLAKADELLRNANAQDKDYPPVAINLAIVSSLQRQKDDPKGLETMGMVAGAMRLAKASGRQDWLAQATILEG